ncbi:MAG: tetratricopeptide repeat protein [Crocinitomicaceae bacterium]|nr:tetratricopeptide repeat protein [Crocinitomicaceae bacterium]
MKNSLFCILVFGFWNFSYAQSSGTKNITDSLWGVWKNEQVEIKERLQAIHFYITKYHLYSQPDSSFSWAKQQFALAESAGLKSQMSQSLNNQGLVLYIKGDPDSALTYYYEALELQTEMNFLAGKAYTQVNIGNSYVILGRFREALSYYLLAEEFQKTGKDRSVYASTLKNIGICYNKLGDFETSLDYYNRALQIMTELKNQNGIAGLYLSIAIIYRLKGDFAKSRYYFDESIALNSAIGNNENKVSAMNGLGNLLRNIGDDETAWKIYDQALNIALELKMDDLISTLYTNMGNCYFEWGQNENAKANFELSLELSKAGNQIPDVAGGYLNLGLVYTEMGERLMAEEYFELSKNLFAGMDYVAGVATCEIGLGTLFYKHQEFEKSFLHFKEAYELSEQFHLRGELVTCITNMYLISIRLDEHLMASSYLSLLKMYKLDEIQTNYFTMPEHEKALYIGKMEQSLNHYFDYTLFNSANEPNYSDTSMNLVLQLKGLTLKSSSALRQIIQESNDSLLIGDYDEWIELRKKTANFKGNENELFELEQRASHLEIELIKNSGAFSDFEKIQNLDWKQVRDGLKEGEAAIEFVHFKSEIDTTNPTIYAAFVVRPNSKHPDVIRLCTENDLKNILGVLQGNNLSFIEKVYGKKSDAKKDLYQKIWQPLEPFLQDVKTVYYSPSGLLHKVSFAAICKEQDIFLSDVYNFRQMGSTGNLAFEDKTEFGELENFLLMGGVNYQSEKESESEKPKEVWNYLPGSLTETEAINSFLLKKKFGVNYFNGSNASEEIFKEKITSSSIVHIATHGFFFPDPEQVKEEMKTNSEQSEEEIKFRGTTNYANWSFVNNKNPLMRSGIVLANANDVWNRDPLAEGEDGILTAQEVSNLDLRNTKLVVLSACETGLGDIKGSEGVFGLQRAFKMAGAKYLIMSLWQVPDKETSEFMILFYKNLIKLKDIPSAFQKTQKVMREKYDPYYWGAFVLIE